jgi:hypothetical protein
MDATKAAVDAVTDKVKSVAIGDKKKEKKEKRKAVMPVRATLGHWSLILSRNSFLTE